MSGMIVATRDKRGLVAGLQWQTLYASGRARSKEIRKAVKAIGAKRIVVFDSGHSVSLGLYVPVDIVESIDGEEVAKAPTKLFSLAAAFGTLVGAASAVLVYQMSDGRVAVIAVTAGLPILDSVYTAEEAQKIANRFAVGGEDTGVSHEIFTNNSGAFRGKAVDEDQLWEGVTSGAALSSPPANLLALILLVALLAGAGAGAFAWDEWSKAKAAEKRRAEARAADPRPKYQAELQLQMGELGVAREDMVSALTSIMSNRVYVAGWALTEVSCSARQQQCAWLWQRDTGTTVELVSALGKIGLTPVDLGKLEVASFSSKFTPPLSGVSDVSEFVPFAVASDQTVHILQLWDNAGVSAPAMAAYTLWPTVSGVDMRKMPQSEAVKTRPFTVSVPLGWAKDVIRSAPSDIWWTDFKITVGGESADPNINLVGASYAF